MKDLVKRLESLSSEMEELNDILSRGGTNRFTESLVYKKVEDGILNKIHTANDHQLTMMMNSYKFRYYTEYNNKEVLRAEIQKRIREHKLKEILNGEEK